jgi:hypothetical protein
MGFASRLCEQNRDFDLRISDDRRARRCNDRDFDHRTSIGSEEAAVHRSSAGVRRAVREKEHEWNLRQLDARN